MGGQIVNSRAAVKIDPPADQQNDEDDFEVDLGPFGILRVIRQYGNLEAKHTSNLGLIMEIFDLSLSAASQICVDHGIRPEGTLLLDSDVDLEEAMEKLIHEMENIAAKVVSVEPSDEPSGPLP